MTVGAVLALAISSKGKQEDLDELFRRTYSLDVRQRRRQVFERPSRLSCFEAYSANDIRFENENKTVDNQDKFQIKDDLHVVENNNSKSRKISEDNFINNERLKEIVENELHVKLDDKKYDVKRVRLWCKSISSSVCEKVIKLTNNKVKVIVSTYIGYKNKSTGVHVAMKCEKVLNSDDVVTIAMEGDSLYAWVTLMLAKY